jgi:hypothetical protein
VTRADERKFLQAQEKNLEAGDDAICPLFAVPSVNQRPDLGKIMTGMRRKNKTAEPHA